MHELSEFFISVCTCGDSQQSNLFEDHKYCCVEKLSSKQCHIGYDGHGYCDSGKTLHIWEPCHNKCYNEYTGNNTSLTPYAMFQCKTYEVCVDVTRMCHGVALCPDKSDVEKCNSNIQCVDISGGFSKYDIHSAKATQHSECRYHAYDHDGEFSTISRTDESNLNIVTQTGNKIDYTTIQNCTYGLYGLSIPGFTCDGGCIEYHLWCRNILTVSCNNNSFSINDKTLCSNNSFWRTQPCNLSFSGYTVAVGLRCTGQIQSCYYPWYTTVFYYYEVGLSISFYIF